MPGLWQKFTEMREIVKKEREKVEREQKKLWKKLHVKDGSSLTNGKFVQRYLLVALSS
jgi:hypothetical protein